jgi:branched-chain amino acid transport system substrate-binding protein
LGTFGPDPRKGAAAASVVERFRERGFEPIGYTLHTYAAVQAWAQAVEASGSLDPAAVIETLHKERFETVLGDIAFDENGDVAAPGFQWYVWSDGEYVPASP